MKHKTASLIGKLVGATTVAGLLALLTNWVVNYFIPSFEVSWANWAMTWLAMGIVRLLVGGNKS
jgi:hypothetical protein